MSSAYGRLCRCRFSCRFYSPAGAVRPLRAVAQFTSAGARLQTAPRRSAVRILTQAFVCSLASFFFLPRLWLWFGRGALRFGFFDLLDLERRQPGARLARHSLLQRVDVNVQLKFGRGVGEKFKFLDPWGSMENVIFPHSQPTTFPPIFKKNHPKSSTSYLTTPPPLPKPSNTYYHHQPQIPAY